MYLHGIRLFLHQTDNHPRHNQAVAARFIPAIDEHYTEGQVQLRFYGVDALRKEASPTECCRR
jgi:hypothetical protein